MSENIMHPTESDFDSMISENKLVLVDFWATWCGPCKMLAPVIESLAEEFGGKAVVAKVDVDQEKGLAKRFGVMSIPTVVIFKDGQEVNREVGFKPVDAYRGILQSYL